MEGLLLGHPGTLTLLDIAKKCPLKARDHHSQHVDELDLMIVHGYKV